MHVLQMFFFVKGPGSKEQIDGDVPLLASPLPTCKKSWPSALSSHNACLFHTFWTVQSPACLLAWQPAFAQAKRVS